MKTQQFRTQVWEYYQAHGRHDLPWRQPEVDGSFGPYKILVSEIMLQQTQVARVLPKFDAFVTRFPTLTDLAAAPLGEVLRAWSGLGYNRRAKFLHQAAQQLARQDSFPHTAAALIKLPGVGPNTAGAILAYAFNQPVVFIETNIRTVYLHYYFHDRQDVPDVAIRDKLSQTLDAAQPRQWYWALMDYGSYLKQTVGNPNARSRHYSKQSAFVGSRRQLRGQIIRELRTRSASLHSLQKQIADERLPSVLDDLLREGLIKQRGQRLSL